ncbi:MAG: hypothetical protein HYU98_05695 [Deltaproteobacteria bacterium]|nr:hypothetical protein [Deltaproteobacteria bacterium]
MLKRGGIPGLDYLASSVVSVLSENFLIYKGGVLIGSHAFQAYSGMFGATFEKSSLRTLDIDIACDIKNIVDAAAIPLRFLDFLIKKPVDSVLIGVRGGIPVTVPHPARYAVHKLIISSQRPVSESAKSAKDIIQAEQIILICAKEQPYELKRAFHEAMRQGPKWKKYIEKGMLKLSSDARSALQ